MSATDVEDLLRRAERAERGASREEAEGALSALVAAAPNHPRSLFILGRREIERGNPAGALLLLARAEAGDGGYAEAPYYSALAHKLLGQFEQALAAIDRALAIDAYFFMAQLSKGALYELLGKKKLAARTYKNAVRIAPAIERLPPAQQKALLHAESIIAAYSESMAQYLRMRTADTRKAHAGEPLARFDESLEILAGLRRRQTQDPLLYYYPRLPAIPFHDRAAFPWLPKLEAATDIIRSELEIAMREDWDKFAPYMQIPPAAPVNQWAELNHSPRWSTLYLWRDGQRQHDVCAKCPQTAALLDELPLARQPGFAPIVVFSVLSPKTRIPPHTGSTNIRLLTHLPLVLQPNCGFRVGNETREWRMGEAWVFDDTIEHEAWNDSDKARVIMILDVWNPLLSEGERKLASELLTAMNEFNAGE